MTALLGAAALHLALLASAAAWLAPAVRPEPNAPVLIVALHSASAAASDTAAAPAATGSPPQPPVPPIPPPKTQPRRPHPAAAPRFAAAPAHPPATVAPQPAAASAPPATANPAIAAAPVAAAPVAAAAEAAAPAARTGASIPAAYAARNRKPDYPLLSRRFNEQGTVVLQVLVAADGSAGEVQIKHSSGHALLDQSALAAARSWRFAAATEDGKPVAEWYQISIPYTLRD